MALRENMSLDLQNALRALGKDLDDAGYGNQGPLVEAFMEAHGWTNPQRVYRALGAVGWTSGRKRRADAGETSVAPETLDALGAALRLGLRDNGKQTMEVPTALSLFARNGHDIPVGPARLRELLRRENLSTAAARQEHAHVAMRSLHPNHVHQVDPSLCLLYYTPNGQQHVLHDSEIYRNKPQWVEKVGNLKCWRYVLYDHRSGVVVFRYYQAKGETQANLYDFLLYAWRRLPIRVFHGVPIMLVWDKGSANGASAIGNALRALDVEDWAHAAGEAQAKGGVENANNLVEKGFESLLKYEPVHSIDELNAAAERWYNAWNANAIPRLDSRLRRPGMEPTARYALWQTIRREQLRLLPDDEVCRYLLTAAPEERLVRATPAGGLSIQFAHPAARGTCFYDLARIPGVVQGMKVQVSPLVYGQLEVLVTVEDYRGDETRHALKPVAFDEAGQRADAPVWGMRYRDNPDTAADKAGKRADRAAFPGLDQAAIEKAKRKGAVPFEGKLKSHSELTSEAGPAFMDRPGTPLDVRNPVEVQARRLNPTELCAALMGKLGAAWDAEMGPAIFAAWPEGAPDSEIPALAAWLRRGEWQAGAVPAQSRPKLAAVK